MLPKRIQCFAVTILFTRSVPQWIHSSLLEHRSRIVYYLIGCGDHRDSLYMLPDVRL